MAGVVPWRSPLVGLAVMSMALAVPAAAQRPGRTVADLEKLPFAPKQAICRRTPSHLTIDGKLDEPAWRATPWSDPFIDIQGVVEPRLRTRMKMLWNDEHLYLAADMEEPDLWGTLRERDSVIFQDNDIEVFIDPDADTHGYYELEVNVLGTEWDLLLVQPYRDGGPAINGWDIAGLAVGIDARGTINRPGDRDKGWTIEIALPWKALQEWAPGRRAPRDGEQWRINFSRVQWQHVVDGGTYKKRTDATGKPLAEDNWVWSPQGIIDMHMPERWGIVQFSAVTPDGGPATFVEDASDRLKWALRRLYYRQREYRARHGRYAAELTALGADAIHPDDVALAASMQATESLYEIRARAADGTFVHIRQDGRIWVTRPGAR